MSKPQAVVALLDLVEDPDLGPLKALTELGPHIGSGFTRLPSAVDVVPAGAVVLKESAPLPSTSTCTETGSQVSPQGFAVRPMRNPAYLRFVRSQPCCVCGSSCRIEAAHTGPHGLGQKSPDTSCIPLCREHHTTGNDSYHALGPWRFAEFHQLDIPAWIEELNRQGLTGREQPPHPPSRTEP